MNKDKELKEHLQEINYRIAKLSDARRHLSEELEEVEKSIKECLIIRGELLG